MSRRLRYVRRPMNRWLVLVLLSGCHAARPFALVWMTTPEKQPFCVRVNEYNFKGVAEDDPRFESAAACEASDALAQRKAEVAEHKVWAVGDFGPGNRGSTRFICDNLYAPRTGIFNAGYHTTIVAKFVRSEEAACRAEAARLVKENVQLWLRNHPDAEPFRTDVERFVAVPGMNKETVRFVAGWPYQTKKLESSDGVFELWVYDDLLLYFEGDVVVRWARP